jgi:hypothetical protein
MHTVTHCYPSLLYSAQCVPHLNSLITFSGDLLSVREKVAVVNVDNVTFLCRAPFFYAAPDDAVTDEEDEQYTID